MRLRPSLSECGSGFTPRLERDAPCPSRRKAAPTLRLFACFLFLALASAGFPADAYPSTIETLTVGPTTYRQVKVRSVNARTLVITHAGGMASIRLRDLSPDWQTRFHYDPAAEAAAEESLAAAAKAAVAAKPIATKKTASKFDILLRSFGQAAEIKTEVDLRPKFFQLELGVKNQGRRPSCAIFAVVSALEFQNAELVGKAEKFSEEYLIWAVRKTVQRMPVTTIEVNGETVPVVHEDADEGFALSEVVDALRTYGIPLQATMPNTFGRRIDAIEEPPRAIVEEARTHQRVFVHQLPGRDNPTRLNNLVQALNAGMPIAVGMDWPHYRSLRNGYLNAQKPVAGSGHAVTIVGYRSTTGKLEDAVFIFKNSWGADWGQGGYGVVTYNYLNQYLHEAVLLEVQTGA